MPHLPGAAVPEQRNTNYGPTEHNSEDECQVPFVYFIPHWCSSCFLHQSALRPGEEGDGCGVCFTATAEWGH